MSTSRSSSESEDDLPSVPLSAGEQIRGRTRLCTLTLSTSVLPDTMYHYSKTPFSVQEVACKVNVGTNRRHQLFLHLSLSVVAVAVAPPLDVPPSQHPALKSSHWKHGTLTTSRGRRDIIVASPVNHVIMMYSLHLRARR